MKLEKLILANFRSYKGETVIDLDNLNVFVGKNDIGKSTILEALDIFFNENKGVIKIDKDDMNKEALLNGESEIIIGAIFGGFPDNLTIDSTNPTTLENEYLLNRDGKLEVIKKYSYSKEKVFINAYHPTNPNCACLLLKKQASLKKQLTDEMICKDKTKNAELRKAIWGYYSDNLLLDNVEIELSRLDTKNVWEQLKRYLPLYTLFQSDRKNSDGDTEIQDPMKLAVQEILRDKKLMDSLNQVADEIETKLNTVSNKTLEKIHEMNPEIANSLKPIIPSNDKLKWADVFKNVSISSDENIPINKRGSGVRRLILLNFFRAEAERRQSESNLSSIIYAIEEPETSQHPKHQRKLVEAFKELAHTDNTQILLTTHSPSIVKLLDFSHVKLIKDGSVKEVVSVQKSELPYPSLNEVNFIAFGESDEEYHNELYGFLEGEGLMSEYKNGKSTISYIRLKPNGQNKKEEKTLSEYIRHQIHHPENQHNKKYSDDELQESIMLMRKFINEK